MTSSCVSVMNCEVDGFSGSITCDCTPATPGTSAMARIDGRRQQAAGREAGAHAHAAPGHRDLAEHEAVAALDEAHDALGHGAERDDPGHADGDAGDGEGVAAQRAEKDRYHSSRDSTGRP